MQTHNAAIGLRHCCACCDRALRDQAYGTLDGKDYCQSCQDAAARYGTTVAQLATYPARHDPRFMR